jgi:hypothetical protein
MSCDVLHLFSFLDHFANKMITLEKRSERIILTIEHEFLVQTVIIWNASLGKLCPHWRPFKLHRTINCKK